MEEVPTCKVCGASSPFLLGPVSFGDGWTCNRCYSGASRAAWLRSGSKPKDQALVFVDELPEAERREEALERARRVVRDSEQRDEVERCARRRTCLGLGLAVLAFWVLFALGFRLLFRAPASSSSTSPEVGGR